MTGRCPLFVVISLGLLVAACGTTVPVTARQAAANGLAGSSPGASVPAPGGAPGVGSTSQGTQGLGGSGATSGGGSAPTGVVASVAPSGGPKVQGVAGGHAATGPIVVGYFTSKDLAATGSAVGLAGIATGNTDNQMKTLADYLNTRGGVLGRKITLVSYDVKTADATSNPDGTAASECAAMADAHAQVLVLGGQNPSLLTCLEKHGIISIDSTDLRGSTASYLAHGNYLFSPSAMSIDRYLPAVVDRLWTRGYFQKWDVRAGDPGSAPVKVGVQAFDNEQGRHYVQVLDSALRRHGLKVDETDLHSTDISQNASATSGAVLRFAANGITHVFNANVLFYKDADSQHYYPRYGIDDTIATPALLASNVAKPGQKGSLHGSMGAGYLPAYEVPNPQDVSPAATRCITLMRNAGEDVSQSLIRLIVLSECDAMTFLVSSMTAGRETTGIGVQRGLLDLKGYESTITYEGKPTQQHHDGARKVRDYTFDDACGCFAFPNDKTYEVP